MAFGKHKYELRGDKMTVSMVRFKQEEGDYFINFLTEIGSARFETEVMISEEDAVDKDESVIVSTAWGRVRADVQYNASKMENHSVDLSNADTAYGYFPIVNKIQILGSALIYATNTTSSAQYTAIFVNQYGGFMQGLQPLWSITPVTQGVTIDDNGIMTVNIQDLDSVLPIEIAVNINEVESKYRVFINPRMENFKTEEQLDFE